MRSLLSHTALVGDFDKRPAYQHYCGVQEAVERLGGGYKWINMWRGREDVAITELRAYRPTLAIYLTRDAVDAAAFLEAAADAWDCPKVFWFQDVTVGIPGMASDAMLPHCADYMFLTNRDEVEHYEDSLKIPVIYLPQGVREKDEFPKRCIVGMRKPAIWVGQRGLAPVHSERSKQLLTYQNVELFPSSGDYDPLNFEEVRERYQNHRYMPCLNMSSLHRDGYTSNRFWVIVQEGGFMISTDIEHYDFEPGKHFIQAHADEVDEVVAFFASDDKLIDRRTIARAAFEHAQSRHGYAERVRTMLRYL